MNARNVMTGATSAIVPGAVIVGTALIVQTLVGVAGQRDQLPVQAGPTVTVTVPPPQPTPTPEPKPAPSSGEGTAVGVVVAAERPGRSTGPDGGMETQPGGGDEHPPTSPADECPRGQLLTIRLPIALLPCGIAVIGGSNPQPTEDQ